MTGKVPGRKWAAIHPLKGAKKRRCQGTVTIETPDHERGIPRQGKEKTVERTEEGELPQGRGDSLVAQLDSALNQAEQFRDQQIQQQYCDQLGVYVQEKAKRDKRPGSRRSRCAWTGWGRLKKLLASSRKGKSKNWQSVSCGGLARPRPGVG